MSWHFFLLFGKEPVSFGSLNTGRLRLDLWKPTRIILKEARTSTAREMRRLDRLTFRVPDAKSCCSFYEQMLGMSSIPSTTSSPSETTRHVVPDKVLGFASNPNGLKLAFVESVDGTSSAPTDKIGSSTSHSPASTRACTTRQSTSKDAYWKIGITVKHLDSAVAYLEKQGVAVSKPAQFQDIGYLCHLRDPAGMSIELLQHAFQGKEDDKHDDKNSSNDSHLHPIGHQATVAHITLRTTDLLQLQHWCSQEMEMQLLSIQSVSKYGFTLYFYGWSNDSSTMPDPSNLKAVENRPWLWARPYGLIEIQHLENKMDKNEEQIHLRPTALDEAGPIELLVVETEATKETVFCRIDCHKDLGL